MNWLFLTICILELLKWKKVMLAKLWSEYFLHIAFFLYLRLIFLFVFLMFSVYHTVEVLLNETAVLPCNVEIPLGVDKVTLIIWYKNDSSLPIYRLVCIKPTFDSSASLFWRNWNSVIVKPLLSARCFRFLIYKKIVSII